LPTAESSQRRKFQEDETEQHDSNNNEMSYSESNKDNGAANKEEAVTQIVDLLG
jgi:hypothetical protein